MAGAGEATAQVGLFGSEQLPSAPPNQTGPAQSIYVHFESPADVEAFARAIGQPVTTQTRYLRFPPLICGQNPGASPPDDEEDDDFEPATQAGLFGDEEWWEPLWQGMPEFDQRDLAPYHSIQVEFPTRADVERFSKLVDQQITPEARRTRSIWYPEAEIGRFADKRYRSRTPGVPRYPVYIISKGRWESRLTAKSLERLGVPYRIVVEPQERMLYGSVIDPAKILALPFRNLGLGSIPARNWVWEHALSEGHDRHWIMDDNIDGFFRLNRNLKTPVADGTIFRAAEDFVDRFENVAISGFHYFMFASRKTKLPPFTLNTRVYSCILIKNDLPYRWRGRYNEDTDLSLRALKDGWSTVLFAAFLAFKSTTMTMKGGNTEELYKDDGRRKMAESLVEQHPDVAKVTWKWGRWQHHVDYRKFKQNKLRPRAGVSIRDGVDDYEMYLEVDDQNGASK